MELKIILSTIYTPEQEAFRKEFEREYGKDKETKYGQWLDLSKFPDGSGRYTSMITSYCWKGFLHGKGVYNPNDKP